MIVRRSITSAVLACACLALAAILVPSAGPAAAAGGGDAANAASKDRRASYGPGIVLRSSAPCATHTLVAPKSREPLYALRSHKVDLDRQAGHTVYVEGRRVRAGKHPARCEGLPIIRVRSVDTLLR